MRIRPIATLSVVAAAVLLLSGCAGSPDAAPTSSPTGTADAGQCQSQLPEGDAAKSVQAAGDFGAAITVTLPSGFAADKLQRAVLTEGTGAEVREGDVIKTNFALYNVSTGKVELDSKTSDPAGMDTLVQSNQIFGAAVACVPLGSRTASIFPAGSLGQGSPAYVLVADAVKELPTRAEGAEVAPVDGMPTVTFDDKGAPTITMPSTPAPSQVRIENLRQGDGDVVKSGDQVIVQYTGALYDGGTVFDSSWQRGTPAQFATTGVVAGFRQALEGQTVGSQVVVVIPPDKGYGDKEQNGIPANSTLVFVIDILGVQHGA